jgi:DNA repair protein RadC
MAKSSPDSRLDRIQATLNTLLVQEKFTLPEMKERLPAELPAYVTRLVHELEKEGHLRADDGTYTWTCELSEFPAQAWVQGKVHGTQVLQSPANDRPRERLLRLGPAALRTAELLAILIRVGQPGESALQAGEKLAGRYANKLQRLPDAGRGELKEISPAIGEAAYCQIMAGIELGRRVAQSFAGNGQRPHRIDNSTDALSFCRAQFARLAADAAQEVFHIVTLDVRHQVVAVHPITVGSLDRSLVHPREVFRPAIKDAAKAIILIHNHPSGDPTPSDEDLIVTRKLEEAGQTLGIEVLDHIIVARSGAASIQEFRARRR